MTMNATAFRRNLFSALDKALQGETIEIEYKGSTVRLTPANPPSKLARLKRRNTIVGDPASIIHTDPELLKEMEAAWEKDWEEL